jgi:hypothetical protein
MGNTLSSLNRNKQCNNFTHNSVVRWDGCGTPVLMNHPGDPNLVGSLFTNVNRNSLDLNSADGGSEFFPLKCLHFWHISALSISKLAVSLAVSELSH